MKNASMTKPVFTEEVSRFFKETGRRGADVHRITPAARQLGVAVRIKKAELIRQGYGNQEALRRARLEVRKTP